MTKPSPETIRTFLASIAETAREDANAIPAAKRASVYRMLTAVYANQTADEQSMQTTNKSNGKGFTGCDARILSDIAQKSARYGNLTGAQARLVAKKLAKYAVQITKSFETHSKAAIATQEAPQASAPAATPTFVEQAPQLIEHKPSRFYEGCARDAKRFDTYGNRLPMKSRAGAKRRPVTLVDGVNTASEVSFVKAFRELIDLPKVLTG